MTKKEFKKAIEIAHMAGQESTGSIPVLNSAEQWFDKEIKNAIDMIASDVCGKCNGTGRARYDFKDGAIVGECLHCFGNGRKTKNQ